jgi:hypothetical protein
MAIPNRVAPAANQSSRAAWHWSKTRTPSVT